MFNVNRLATTKNPKADIMVDDNDTAETIAFTSVSAVPVGGVRTPLLWPTCLSIYLSVSESHWHTHPVSRVGSRDHWNPDHAAADPDGDDGRRPDPSVVL
jgi:hypothetical protein